MSLPTATMNKLMREQFTDNPPIRVTDENRVALVAAIKERVALLNDVEIAQNHYVSDRDKAEFLLGLTVKNPSAERYYYSNVNLRITIGAGSALTVSTHYGSNSATIADLDELFAFIEVCRERLQRKLALKNRRQKVRDLKAQAIIARVKQLAKEEKFDFATDTDTQKLKLYVRLSDKDCIQLQIPFNKFEEMLPNLRTAILSLRELYDKGIRFKLHSTDKIGWRRSWITHESLA